MKKLIFLLLFFPLFTSAQVIVTAVGGGTTGLGDDGTAIDAELKGPFGVNLDDSGNLYICDAFNNRIRKVSPGYGGIIKTVAGNGTAGYSGDNGLGIYAQVFAPTDLIIDRYGNVYIADQGNNCIRKVTPLDTITTIAGTGVAGYNGDNMPATAAQLNSPSGVTVDTFGNIYIADEYNYRIRKIDTAGIITTIVGTGVAGFSPDGSIVDTANLNDLLGIRINKTGNLFFADNFRIRKIDSGFIYTVAGNGISGYSGDSGLATSAEIGGGAFTIDSFNNICIADAGADRVREVNVEEGIIYTIAGNGTYGFSGDYGSPLLAELNNVEGVVMDNSGDVYISDNGNNRIRLITKHPLSVKNVSQQVNCISIFPNPCENYFTGQVTSSAIEYADVVVENITGAEVYKFSTQTNQPFTIQFDWPPGVYIINATTIQQHFTQKIIIQ